jgi:hypothetical protein
MTADATDRNGDVVAIRTMDVGVRYNLKFTR